MERKADSLAGGNFRIMEDEVVTHRTMLSLPQRVFGPISFTSPISLSPKLLLQQCWTMKGEWDKGIPENVRRVFLPGYTFLILKQSRLPSS
jgi:hypothetical protein